MAGNEATRVRGRSAPRARRGRSSLWSALAVVVVLALAGALALGGRAAWQDGRLNPLICGGDCGPSNVIAPEGLRPVAPGDETVSQPVADGAVDPAAVVAAVQPLLDDGVLGSHVGFAAADATTGAPVGVAGADGAFTPASTTKLTVALAALLRLDPQTRFATSVVDAGDQVVLVGGGDPFLTDRRDDDSAPVERAQLSVLAQSTAVALKRDGRTSITLGYDDSLFTGPSASPGWEPGYVPANIVTPISALWVNRGITDGIRSREPAAAAASRFAELLRDRGIDVASGVDRVEAPDQVDPVAVVRSSTVAQIVEALLRTSNNEATEAMLRQVAIAAGEPATFTGGDAAVIATLDEAGVDTEGMRLLDGSGLSRKNLISPTTLVQVVRTALDTPRASALLDDLPLSGFSGTLDDRLGGDARGLVRAKTGTLTGVHSLAGYALDADGRPVVFAVMADRSDRVQGLAVQASLDKIVSAITACSCG